MRYLKKLLFLIIAFFYYQIINGQNADSTYFGFWEGTWFIVMDGKIDTSSNRFEVSKGLYDFVFEEDWRMGDGYRAKGIRAWDIVNQRWQYIWMGESGLFQIWEGRKVGEHWYIYKRFNINGDKYLSRQAWIPMDENKLMRISEKSYDDGKTWELRFKEYYEKISP